MSVMTENDWESQAMEALAEVGWEPKRAVDINPGSGERQSWSDLILQETLHTALKALNHDVPAEYLRQAAEEALRPESQDLEAENYRMHRIMTEGYRKIEYIDHDGQRQNPVIRFTSRDPGRNIYTAVQQVILRRQHVERRFDIVLYLNGLPVSIIELKNAGAAASSETAYNQLCSYVHDLPTAFQTAVVVVATDGLTARYGTPFTPWNHFSAWNVDEDGTPTEIGVPDEHGDADYELDLLIYGVFDQMRFLQLMYDYVAFDSSADRLTKRIAKPHQYFAVSKAVGCTIQAVRSDGRAGVVWHTQGSGKSMEMELYTARIMRHEELANPTVVVITDRTELDTQLFDGFQRSTLLPESPISVSSRADLRTQLMQRRTGGILFTTLQKFGLTEDERDAGSVHPLLSDRKNIVVVVDEAHRSHYDDLDGYARHLRDALPHATLIAFTGTPISETDRDTRQVFGDHIDVYDLHRAVEDGATVPVVFEARVIKIDRTDDDDAALDTAALELTRGLDEPDRERAEQAAARLETIYGSPGRLRTLAEDLVRHWENRKEAMRPFLGPDVHGKAMVVTSTRSIAARLYDEIVALRPDWHNERNEAGKIKVVYSADATDGEPISRHRRRPSENAAIKKRMQTPEDKLEIVIVKDMMLTGFDAPALHTLYVDRPLKGALLMQTLARVNRTFRGKRDGLLVGYAPLQESLQKALKEFTTDAGETGKKEVGQTAAEAAEILEGRLEQLRQVVPVEWEALQSSQEPKRWKRALTHATAHLRSPQTTPVKLPDGSSKRADQYFREVSGQLARAWSLASGVEAAEKHRDKVRFYGDVRTWMAKLDARDRMARGEPVPEDIRQQLGDLVVDSAAVTGVLDIYAEAGIDLPRLDALTPQWLESAAQPNKAQLAIEALRTGILEKARSAAPDNERRQKQFSERVDDLMTKYTNQQLTAAEIMAALAELAAEAVAEGNRGDRFDPPLSRNEIVFYDAVSENEPAVEIMGDDALAVIARELVALMRRDLRTDWTVREDVKAKLRANVLRLLRRHKYPPEGRDEAFKIVLEQMERMAPSFDESEGH